MQYYIDNIGVILLPWNVWHLMDIIYTFFLLHDTIKHKLKRLCCLINDKELVYIFPIEQIPGSQRWKRDKT